MDVQLVTAIGKSRWTLTGVLATGQTSEAWRVQRGGRVAFLCLHQLGPEVVLNLSDRPETRVQFTKPTLAVDVNFGRDLPDFLEQLEFYARQDDEAASERSLARSYRRSVAFPERRQGRRRNLRCVSVAARA